MPNVGKNFKRIFKKDQKEIHINRKIPIGNADFGNIQKKNMFVSRLSFFRTFQQIEHFLKMHEAGGCKEKC